jgi:hypothetical protein
MILLYCTGLFLFCMWCGWMVCSPRDRGVLRCPRASCHAEVGLGLFLPISGFCQTCRHHWEAIDFDGNLHCWREDEDIET